MVQMHNARCNLVVVEFLIRLLKSDSLRPRFLQRGSRGTRFAKHFRRKAL